MPPIGPFLSEAFGRKNRITKGWDAQLSYGIGRKQDQMRFKMQKDGEPVWDQTVMNRLWVTTQREAIIEEGPPVEKPAVSNAPAKKADEAKPK
jgi:hypothetical protein